MEENQVVVPEAEAVEDAAAEPIEQPAVEGVIVPTALHLHIVTVRVDVDGKPVEASFFGEDLSHDTECVSIRSGAPIVSVRSCAPETPPKQVLVPHAVIKRIRARLARLT